MDQEAKRAQLLGLSLDALAAPELRAPGGAAPGLPTGWGIGCYVDDERAAHVVRDGSVPQPPLPGLEPQPADVWRSTTFVAQSPGRDSAEVGPSRRGYAGRHFLLAVAGPLAPELRTALALGDDFDLAPVGDSPGHHALSWLVAQMRQSGARVVGEYGWGALRNAFATLNQWGAASFLFSDGIDLVAYRDAREEVPLHWGRRVPPHESGTLEGSELVVDCDGPRDATRTALVFSTLPLKGARWMPLEPGELRVARRGVVVWSSHPSGIDEQVFSHISGLGGERSLPAPNVPALAAPVGSTRIAPARLRVVHETTYRYAQPVERSNHRFCLLAADDRRQEVIEQVLSVSVNGLRRDFEDVFGNRATIYDVTEPFQELRITSELTVDVQPVAVGDLRSPLRRDQIPLVWMPWQRQMMQAYLLPPELPEVELRELSEFAMSFVERNDYDLVETLLDLNRTIYRDFTYVPSSTTVETTPYQVYTERRGVCQDFANVMICVARLLGVPARYRVGYIYTGGNYENRIQSDASHAWAEMYLPWTGWCGFDPTNGCLAGVDHVRVACGRHYRDAAPTSGTLFQGGGGEQLSVRVEVDRLDDE